jgi:hypothetical protein
MNNFRPGESWRRAAGLPPPTTSWRGRVRLTDGKSKIHHVTERIPVGQNYVLVNLTEVSNSLPQSIKVALDFEP